MINLQGGSLKCLPVLYPGVYRRQHGLDGRFHDTGREVTATVMEALANGKNCGTGGRFRTQAGQRG